jgi:4-carboxymuconolactone decarboxylase
MATPRLLHLAAAIAAVWRGDWSAFAAAATALRADDTPRADLEETLLQAVLFAGFPRVVTAFEHLNRTWPSVAAPAGGGLPPAEQAAAGRALFAAIYGKNDLAVRNLLRDCHQEFHDFVLEAAYGRILTRPGLPPRERELLACAALAAQQQDRQFVAHARGALQFGASREELAAVTQLAQPDADAAAALLRRVR